MSLKFIIIVIGTWFLFMIFAIINAILRNGVYKPIIGELRAHQLSTIIFIFIIIFINYLVFKYFNFNLTSTESFLIGALWLIMTICFEFLAGHFIFGNTWEKLIADYNILKGRIWGLVLVTIFISPRIVRFFY